MFQPRSGVSSDTVDVCESELTRDVWSVSSRLCYPDREVSRVVHVVSNNFEMAVTGGVLHRKEHLLLSKS